MKRFYLLLPILFSLILVITSCGDNFETSEIDITTSDPERAESILLTGFIKDSNNNPIEDAALIIHHDDEVYELSSDNSGEYSINLPNIAQIAYLQAEAQEFVRSGIKGLALTAPTINKDVTMLRPDELDQEGEVKLLESSSLPILSGNVLLENGQPAAFHRVILVGFPGPISSIEDIIVTYDVTDSDGFYNIAHEPFENFILGVGNDCMESNIISINVSMDTMDLDLGTFQSDFSDFQKFEVAGFITDCVTGEGLEQGWLTISLVPGNDDNEVVEVINGHYNTIVNNCEGVSCFDMSVYSTGASVGWNRVECVAIDDQVELDHTLCGDDRVVNDGILTLYIGSDTLIYTGVNADNEIGGSSSRNWFLFHLDLATLDNVSIFSTGEDVGTHGILDFSIIENSQTIYRAINTGVFVIDSIDDYIEGSVSGVVKDIDDQEIPFSGTYRVQI